MTSGGYWSDDPWAPHHRDPYPWDTPVDGHELFLRLTRQVETYVCLPRREAMTIALWIAHTYLFEAFETSPILAILSPLPRCGKTTLLGVLEALVRRPQPASHATPAALFRIVEDQRPTLLVDETDRYLAGNNELITILNSGHTPQGWVLRAQGSERHARYSTYCPKALAMIGEPPSTILDRSIVVRLKRRVSQ